MTLKQNVEDGFTEKAEVVNDELLDVIELVKHFANRPTNFQFRKCEVK